MQRAHPTILTVGVFLLVLLTLSWFNLPYSQMDWVVAGQPYEPTITPTATSEAVTKRVWLPVILRHPKHLPDLVVDHVFNTLCPNATDPQNCGCVRDLESGRLMACIRNRGTADTGPFTVNINTPLEDSMLRVANMSPGRRLCIIDGEVAASAEVLLDTGNEVVESREDNNRWAGDVTDPPVPPICTLTPTPTNR